MWKELNNFELESECKRFIIFKLFSGKAQMVDRGTDTVPRLCRNFGSVRAAKISAAHRLSSNKTHGRDTRRKNQKFK